MPDQNISESFDSSPSKPIVTQKKKIIPWREISPSVKLLHHKIFSKKEKVITIYAPSAYIFDFYIGGEFGVLYEGKLYKRHKNTAVIHSRTPGIAEFRIKKKMQYEFFAIAIEKEFLKEMIKLDQSMDYKAFLEFNEISTLKMMNANVEIINRFSQLVKDHKNNPPILLLSHIYMIINLLIEQFLFETAKEKVKTSALNKWELNEVRKISAQIKNHPQREYSISQSAFEAGITVQQVQIGFKEMHQMTFARFVRENRLEKAANLLRKSNLNVTQAAYSVGFASRSNFSRIFKKKYGLSPSEYKMKHNTD